MSTEPDAGPDRLALAGEHRLRIHETTLGSGRVAVTWLVARADGVLAIEDDDGARTLPGMAIDAVMEHYGHPFDPTERVVAVGELVLEDGARIRHVRHLARFDVVARDYLVFERPSREPLCAMATTVAGALDYIERAVNAR